MIGVTLVLLGTIAVGFLILKKYYAPWSLLLVGLVLLLLSGIIQDAPILNNKTATNSLLFDIVQVFTNISKSTAGGLGMQILIISGFADYLDKIGATQAFVRICAKPLQHIHSPYLLLGVSYLVGQLMNIFIPSAVGLGVLLMLTIYPLLMSVGVSRVSAAAVIVTSSCLDLGPASANSLVVAKIADIGVIEYFVENQIPVALPTIIIIAIAHAIIQRWLDQKDLKEGRLSKDDFKLNSCLNEVKDLVKVPSYYAILPLFPIILLFVFSKFCITSIKLPLETAILTCLIVSFLVRLVTTHNFESCMQETQVIFKGMGKVFTSTVSLIICAGVFAEGLKQTGGIDTIINLAASIQETGGIVMLVVMCAILMLAAVATGSANAAFFAFAELIPGVAKSVMWPTVVMACPVQLVSGIARSMSPVAGVAIAVSSVAGLSPFAVVRRTIPVMIIAGLSTMVSALLVI